MTCILLSLRLGRMPVTEPSLVRAATWRDLGRILPFFLRDMVYRSTLLRWLMAVPNSFLAPFSCLSTKMCTTLVDSIILTMAGSDVRPRDRGTAAMAAKGPDWPARYTIWEPLVSNVMLETPLLPPEGTNLSS